MLKLLRVEMYNSYELYVFRVESGNTIKLPYNQAIELVSRTPSKERNCKVVKGRIQLKPNEGSLCRVNMQKNEKGTKDKKERTVVIESKEKSIDILSNNQFFYKVRRDMEFIDSHRDIINSVDKAVVTDLKNGTIITPYGVTNIIHISTGCKTLLNIAYLLEKGDKRRTYRVSMDECGENIIPILFDMVADTNIILCLHHYFIFIEDEGYRFKVNGKIADNWNKAMKHI